MAKKEIDPDSEPRCTYEQSFCAFAKSLLKECGASRSSIRNLLKLALDEAEDELGREQKPKTQWQHTTWEKGDCVYEGLRLKIKGKFELVGFWFMCGIDACPSSTQFGDRGISDKEAHEWDSYLEKCLQNAERIKAGEENVDLRVDKP
jgi:hypothetical protein